MKIFNKLSKVQKPGRYIGEEYNSIKKDWSKIEVKVLLSYPDIYEIGMSNLGLAILYGLLNSKDDILCERCFTPWKDMEELLQKLNEPLFSLESKIPINKFDLIGFSLQHELNYTNILTILRLGKLKIWQKERKNIHPLIIGGGPCTLNPEPIADFFDFFIIGDAEEVILEILEEVRKWKKNQITRNELLKKISKLEGIYVSSLYKIKQTKEGFLIPEVKDKVKKVVIPDINTIPYPEKPIVPYIQIVHDRINLEIMRGCPNSCRFCQARVYYGPFRYRKVEDIIQVALESYQNTGHEEICLSSLSSGDYPYLLDLLDKLKKNFNEKYVFLSLPSLWIGKNMSKILNRFLDSKRPGLTFAPEVTSMRMKEIIGKFIEEEDLIQVIKYAFNRGWKKIKLYYMLGLPGLEEEDLRKMQEFIFRLLRMITGRGREIRLSFSTFIPKPHTPMQWAKFISKKTFKNQFNFIKKNLSKPSINWEVREYEFSLLEAVLSRGDRKLSKVIYEAWRIGARFDSWGKEFNFTIWEEAFKSLGINYKSYIEPKWNKRSILPWEHIDSGISKEFFWRNYESIRRGFKNRNG